MKAKKPYTQFDLPRVHLSEYENHYTLPADEHRSEVVILDRQARGLRVAGKAIELLLASHIDDGGFTARLLASSALNSAWYTYGRDEGMMRRALPLPLLAVRGDKGEWRQDREGLLKTTNDYMDHSYWQTKEYEYLKRAYRHDEGRRKQLGKSLGVTSLSLACLDVVEETRSGSVYDVQCVARDAALRTLEDARDLGRVIGVYPSMAQVGNEASELMLYVRRKAPTESRELFDSAIDLVDSEALLGK